MQQPGLPNPVRAVCVDRRLVQLLAQDKAADGEDGEEDETARMFRQAAEALKQKREVEALPVEERIARWASLRHEQEAAPCKNAFRVSLDEERARQQRLKG